ncbi:MAG: DegV family protein [Chloroflexi bacterium]|nr:DegV family protein [Chloroflexota bacterium]
MTQVRIVCDSTASIPPSIAAELEITIVHAFINFGSESYRDALDLSEAEFYAKLAASPKLPTTAVPPPGVFEETYQRLGADGAAIVSIHLNSRLSGMCNAATAAARALPDRNITVVDSQALSMGLGWVAILAARAAREGGDATQVVARAQSAIARVHLLAALDTFENVRRSGRVNFPQAFLGTLFDIKPILDIRADGVHPIDKVRARRAATERVIELITELSPFEELAVIHTNAPQRGIELREQLARVHPRERILVVEAGAILATPKMTV